MKKKFLSTAVAAGLGLGLVGTANAVYVNPEGTGDVLLYPIYNTEGDYNTNIHVVNTTDRAKAVKVRFLESKNSREVLDFNLYLSEKDEWTGSVVRTADGAMLVSNDESCTTPGNAALKSGVDFRTFEFDGNKGPKDSDSSAARTRIGYVEIIHMADITQGSDLEAAVTHTVDAGGTTLPANCALVASNNNNADLNNQIDSGSTGGLYGYGTLVNLNTDAGTGGFAATYDAVALDGYRSTGQSITVSGSLDPSLGLAEQTATVFSNGTLSTYTTADGWDAVSAALMASHVMNDYVVGSATAIDPGTDWVLTFPTKRHYVNNTPVELFANSWSTADSESCQPVNVTYYDREEQFHQADDTDFSPQPDVDTGSALCYEANIFSFNGSNVLGALGEDANGRDLSSYNLDLQDGYNEGWADMDLTNSAGTNPAELDVGDGAGNTVTLQGLPVVGFSIIEFSRGDLGGLKANFAGITEHKRGLNN